MRIRLPLSIDHQKKKAMSLYLPFSLYLHFVSCDSFEAILPDGLREKAASLKEVFNDQNRFFSEDYKKEYERSPYIRFLTGPDVHKFFAKMLSLNYQTYQHILQAPVGSFQEYFADLNLFWNAKYTDDLVGENLEDLRTVLFCQACIQSQYQRVMDKKSLHERLDEFAKDQLREKDRQIKTQKREIQKMKMQYNDIKAELSQMQEKNVVLVPSDPHYMLGLHPDQSNRAPERAKVLLKVLHPDKSGTNESGYLFDMIVKARDMIIK